MKIISINNAPAVRNGDGSIRGDVTDIGKILDNIDQANGRVTVTYKGQVIHDNVFVPGWGPIAGLFSFAARCGGENEYQAIANLTINTVLQSATVVAPTILANPLSASVPEGGSTNFTVSADGTAPFTFQWTKNGTDIAGATGTSLTYGPVSYAADNNAQFACKVSNAASTISAGPWGSRGISCSGSAPSAGSR